ncbi:uncharacterized protein BX664DRAFT_387730 [Halteromyces radiatus]|uniref:uncharacterized protein n=1 Tax=Halteromyces radiatus TaxID=101107 RepID=UPI00221EF8D8|nr:uncharacterized protein BX664DRAFT_387730 [Halteromyces radiatus]KAI8085094.1 hypothetical protein BX664DRAFT_387730 [Halteromyces radiatus]
MPMERLSNISINYGYQHKQNTIKGIIFEGILLINMVFISLVILVEIDIGIITTVVIHQILLIGCHDTSSISLVMLLSFKCYDHFQVWSITVLKITEPNENWIHKKDE